MGNTKRTTEGYECYSCGKIAPQCGCIPVVLPKERLRRITLELGPLKTLTPEEDMDATLLALEIIDFLDQDDDVHIWVASLFKALSAIKDVHERGIENIPPLQEND